MLRDMRGAAQLILDHLHDLGHRGVAYLGGHSAARSHAEHFQWIQEGVRARGMAFVGGIQMVGLQPEEAEKEMKKILGKKERPTAVVCGSDAVATGATRAILAAGISIPREISMAGLGDGELSRHGAIPLTTIRFPSLGRTGFGIWKKAREDKGEMKPVIVGGELIVRESTGKA